VAEIAEETRAEVAAAAKSGVMTTIATIAAATTGIPTASAAARRTR